VKERPILFQGAMVRALLAGTKTQTRRALRLPHGLWETSPTGELVPIPAGCPYGQPGVGLWVREAFGISYDGSAIPWTGADAQRDGEVIYRATFDEKPDEGRLPWKPSIHMPRWASRITLEVTGVRVERLQDISEADALAEGIVQLNDGFGLPAGEHFHAADPRQSYLSLWEAINGPGSVDANPLVWAVEFRRLETAIAAPGGEEHQ